MVQYLERRQVRWSFEPSWFLWVCTSPFLLSLLSLPCSLPLALSPPLLCFRSAPVFGVVSSSSLVPLMSICSFNYQQNTVNVTIKPGDRYCFSLLAAPRCPSLPCFHDFRISTHCVYNTRSRSAPTSFGHASEDEMCMEFILYVRLVSFHFVSCRFVSFIACSVWPSNSLSFSYSYYPALFRNNLPYAYCGYYLGWNCKADETKRNGNETK